MNFAKLMLSGLTLSDKQHINSMAISYEDVNASHSIDGLIPKTQNAQSFLFLLDNKLRISNFCFDNPIFFALPHHEYLVMASIYHQYFNISPVSLSYKFNFFTSDNYIKNYPFIEFQELYVFSGK